MTAIGQLVNKAIKSIELVVSLQQTPWPRHCVKSVGGELKESQLI